MPFLNSSGFLRANYRSCCDLRNLFKSFYGWLILFFSLGASRVMGKDYSRDLGDSSLLKLLLSNKESRYRVELAIEFGVSRSSRLWNTL